jgi:3-deoxy-7-phosphoheptulonate synthase
VIQKLSHLPIFVDPSHAAGKRPYVGALALAGVAAGCDGLMIEVHPSPDHALSDGNQSLNFQEFAELMPRIAAVARAVGRRVASTADELAAV